MADQDKKTSALTPASELSDDDFNYIVDKSDTSMAPTGTNKKIEKILNKEYYNYAKYTTDNDDHTISERGPIFHTQTKAATDKKVELTDTEANDGQLITVKVIGSSAGLVVLDTVNGATVDGESVDGIAANTKWKWDGNGNLTLRYNHSNTDYEIVCNGIWDSGNNADGNFCKQTNTDMTCYNTDSTVLTTDQVFGSVYVSEGLIVTFPLTFVTPPTVSPAPEFVSSAIQWQASGAVVTTTGTTFRLVSGTNTGTGHAGYIAKGQWR